MRFVISLILHIAMDSHRYSWISLYTSVADFKRGPYKVSI